MKIRTGLARLRYGLVTLLADCALFVVCCGVLAAAAPLLFILSAQLYRLGTTGDWHPVPLSDLLNVTTVGLSAQAHDNPLVAFLLACPATVILLAAVLVFYAIGRLLSRLKARERRKFHDAGQRALIGDIERAFEKAQRTAQRDGAA
jgi:hypothetical protein